jgi:predicted helicase
MPRGEVMQHMLEENVGLITRRQMLGSKPCNYVFISDKIISDGIIRSDNKGGESIFPLYLYPETNKKDLFNEHETGEKKPNIKPELFEELKKNFKKEVTPEEIFYYIYAVLYSNIYRTKYAEFLKIDFPRVPFTKDYKLFIQLAKLGKQLADLHLLKSNELEKTISKFPIEGNNKVEKPRFDNGKVWINKEQYFDGVKEEVWQYQIGGYQVCDKWLKDRKDRTLTLDEIKTYCKIVTALSKTIDLQKEIDKYFEEVEKTVESIK